MKVIGSSIQQLEKDRPPSRCRKWRLWATVEGGKRKSRRLAGTYKEAEAALSAFVKELEAAVPNGETFASYASRWREWREQSGDLDVQTLVNDKRNVNVLGRVLGGERMDAITPEKVKSALLELKHGGSTYGGELSGTYMNNLFVALNNIMQTAEDDGKIARNPCAKIKAPKADTAERRALTTAQMDEVWRNVAPLARGGDGRAMAVLLMLDSGLRPQEAFALKPGDVDLKKRCLHVRKAMKERDGSIGKTKRPASVRDVPMTDRLAEACVAYSGRRKEGIAFCGNTRDGSHIRGQNFRKWWEARREGFGASGLVPYELRHSNLTKMARFMTPYDLMAWAGWSSIAPAMVYVHRDQSQLEAAVRRSQIGAVLVYQDTDIDEAAAGA